jgi:predicted permease
VRLSLGASRLGLIRQLLTESLVLALAGGVVGIAVAFAGTQLLIALMDSMGSHIAIPFELDWRTLGFTAAIALATGLLFGLAPAIRATRIDLSEPMKNARGASRTGAARTLVAAQVAVSMLLLVASGLFLRTLYNLKSEDLGYNPEHLVLLRVDPVAAGYRGDDVGRSMRALLDRIRAIPGVRRATFSENGLFSGTESGADLTNIEGFTPHTDEDRETRFDQIGPDYFSTLGIPILLGREIKDSDLPGAPRVAVINDTMAKFYFPGVSPVGKHITNGHNVTMEIVGVIRDAQDHDLRAKPVRRFYVSYFQPIDGITTANFEIRTAANPASVMAELRGEVERFNRNLPIRGIEDIRQLIDESLVSERLIAKLSTFFGGLAILLAAIGLYGVTSYAVARRTTEIGIRMALGAPRTSVIAMILGEVAALLIIGGAVGAAAAFASARLIQGFLFGLAPLDLMSLAGATALLAIIGALAGYLPARRASKIDPTVALRYE